MDESKASSALELQARLGQAELDEVTARHKSQALMWSKIAVVLTFAQMGASLSFLLVLDTGLIFDPNDATSASLVRYTAGANILLSLIGWFGASIMSRAVVNVYKMYMFLYLVILVVGVALGAGDVPEERVDVLYGYFGGLFVLWLLTDVAVVSVANKLKALENTVFYTN